MKESRLIFLIITCLFLLVFQGKAQHSNGLDLYQQKLKMQASKVVYKPKPFIQLKDKPAYIRYNPVAYFLGGLLYGYQNVVSPQISAGCQYRPTCSQFAVDALKTTNMIAALGLIADRLSRCTICAMKDAAEPVLYQEQNIIIDAPCCPR